MMMELIDIKCLGKKSYGNLHIHYFPFTSLSLNKKNYCQAFNL